MTSSVYTQSVTATSKSIVKSPSVSLTVDYESGQRKFSVDTPVRRHTLKQVYRREYTSAINSLQKNMSSEELVVAPAKKIMSEIQGMCSLESNSILRDSDKALQSFNWELVWNELTLKAPTLLQFYKLLFRGAPKALICFAVSLIIKWRSPRMCLVQRVISTMLYGHGTGKQVRVSLHLAFTVYVFSRCIIVYNHL